MHVAWSLGGLDLFVVMEVLVLLGGVGGLFFDESLGLVVSGVVAGEVLELCVQIALGNQVASVNPRRGAVCPSSHLRIPNDLVATVAWGSGAG